MATQPAPLAPYPEHLAWARQVVAERPPRILAFEFDNFARSLAILSWKRPQPSFKNKEPSL